MKRLALSEGTTARARALRGAATDAEKALWRALREGFPAAHFRRQVPLGPYFADFASHRHRLVIEADGGQHGIRAEQDAVRTRFLEGQGYRVLRFWNNDIVANIDGVMQAIAAALISPPPCGEDLLIFPSPCGEGRVGAPPASAGEETSAHAANPLARPNPPHEGEGVISFAHGVR